MRGSQPYEVPGAGLESESDGETRGDGARGQLTLSLLRSVATGGQVASILLLVGLGWSVRNSAMTDPSRLVMGVSVGCIVFGLNCLSLLLHFPGALALRLLVVLLNVPLLLSLATVSSGAMEGLGPEISTWPLSAYVILAAYVLLPLANVAAVAFALVDSVRWRLRR